MMIKNIIKRFLLYVIKGIPDYKVYPQITNLNSSELLVDRVALITGGSSGIGFSIAKSFSQPTLRPRSLCASNGA